MRCDGCGALGACEPTCPLKISFRVTIEAVRGNTSRPVATIHMTELRGTSYMADYAARIDAPACGVRRLPYVEVLGAPRTAGAVWVLSEALLRAFHWTQDAPERWY